MKCVPTYIPSHSNILNCSIQDSGFGLIHRVDRAFGKSTDVIDPDRDLAAQSVAIAITVVGSVDHRFVVGHVEVFTLLTESEHWLDTPSL